MPVHCYGAGLLEAVGNTPLLELRDLPGQPAGTRLFAKLETANPGGSIKDRPVSRIIAEALRAGRLAGGRRLLDSSSGNAGIAYAMYGAHAGIDVTLVVPGNASRERLDRIAAHGAELILTDPIEGYDFALREAARLADEQPERYWHANQYANDENWRAHFDGTGVEIIRQLEARGVAADALVAGVGTGGTLTGCGRRLRQAFAGLHIAAVIPDRFPGIEGLKPLGLPGDIVPQILDEQLIDERIEVASEAALDMASELARRGLFVGPSSGAYVHAALRTAWKNGHRAIVTLLNDTGERYGSTGMWRRDA